VETVRFTPPERVDFRLVRGPVPQVTEAFVLTGQDQHTRVDYHGELGTDLWAVGQAWATVVAARWNTPCAPACRPSAPKPNGGPAPEPAPARPARLNRSGEGDVSRTPAV
jgi:hypothetical protein